MTTLDLALKDVHKSFGATEVLKGVSLEVERGVVVALLGANGSGKSTLLRTSLRLIEPDQGKVTILDQDISRARLAHLRRVRSQVGFVFQRHNLVPKLSALTNVIHGILGRSVNPRNWYQGFASRPVREKALNALELVGLADIAARRVDRLSGGQSQRVAIARALMQEPQLILADEPVASLDPVAAQEVMELLVGLSRDQALTLVFTSHNVEHSLNFPDRIVGLKAGRIELDSDPSEIAVDRLKGFYERDETE